MADEVRAQGPAEAAGTTREALMAQARGLVRSLPADQFPNLIAAADDISSDDPVGLFEFGLDLLIRGLEPLVRKPSVPLLACTLRTWQALLTAHRWLAHAWIQRIDVAETNEVADDRADR